MALAFGSGPDSSETEQLDILLRDSMYFYIIKNDWTIISPGQNCFPTSFTRLISYNFY